MASEGAGHMVRVVRVVDGDTIILRLADRDERVRIVGMDAPESVAQGRPVECFGPEASARAHQLLDGQTVRATTEPRQGDRDDFGRLLRHIWLPDGQRFAEVMIREGYAWPLIVGKGHAFERDDRAAEREARAARRGLWAADTCNGQRRPAR